MYNSIKVSCILSSYNFRVKDQNVTEPHGKTNWNRWKLTVKFNYLCWLLKTDLMAVSGRIRVSCLFLAAVENKRIPFMSPNKLVITISAALVATHRPSNVILLLQTNEMLIIKSGSWPDKTKAQLALQVQSELWFQT